MKIKRPVLKRRIKMKWIAYGVPAEVCKQVVEDRIRANPNGFKCSADHCTGTAAIGIIVTIGEGTFNVFFGCSTHKDSIEKGVAALVKQQASSDTTPANQGVENET